MYSNRLDVTSAKTCLGQGLIDDWNNFVVMAVIKSGLESVPEVYESGPNFSVQKEFWQVIIGSTISRDVILLKSENAFGILVSSYAIRQSAMQNLITF